MTKSLFVAMLALSLAACTKEPPKCSDSATVTLAKEIILDLIGFDAAAREKAGAAVLDRILVMENMRPSAYDEKIKKFSCEATLLVHSGDENGTGISLPVTYASQLGDKGNHLVEVTGLLRGDLQQVDHILAMALQRAIAITAPEAAAAPEPVAAGAEEAPDHVDAAAADSAAETSDTVQASGVCKGLDLAVTVDQSECVGRKFAIADNQLNADYQRLMAVLGPDRQAELKASQRAWIKEKDQTCEEAGKEAEGGTLQPILIGDCTVRMTEERIAFLAGFK